MTFWAKYAGGVKNAEIALARYIAFIDTAGVELHDSMMSLREFRQTRQLSDVPTFRLLMATTI